jgi:ketosteroid isomerase-like protein
MPTPTLTPGQIELVKLEGDFSEAVTKGGGKAFSSWFADDGITLNNGQPAVLGRSAIAATANWDPATYQLSWYAEGAQMGPSNDTGFTWGHYDATSVGKDGKSTTFSGRYITFWKKVNGQWKVALDASANEPPVAPGSLPKP